MVAYTGLDGIKLCFDGETWETLREVCQRFDRLEKENLELHKSLALAEASYRAKQKQLEGVRDRAKSVDEGMPYAKDALIADLATLDTGGEDVDKIKRRAIDAEAACLKKFHCISALEEDNAALVTQGWRLISTITDLYEKLDVVVKEAEQSLCLAMPGSIRKLIEKVAALGKG